MLDRVTTALIAVGLAFLVWMYTRSRDEEVLDNYQVPVEVQVAPAQEELYELEISGPGQVPVSFSGPPSRIRELRTMLQHGDIRIQRTVSVPDDHLDDARYPDVLRLDATEVALPPGVRAVIPENQSRLHVSLRRLVEKRLPVKLVHTGADRVENVTLEPATVLVRGPKELLERQESFPTQLFTVPIQGEGSQPQVVDRPEQVPLTTEVAGRTVRVSPVEVSVRYTLKPRQRTRELMDIAVHFLCPTNFPYRPEFTSDRLGKITLRVQGPASEERPAVSAFVDLTSRKFGPGLHAEEPIQVQLPPGFELAQEPPRLSSFRLIPLDLAAKPADVPFPP
jgi:hypothetical protein